MERDRRTNERTNNELTADVY